MENKRCRVCGNMKCIDLFGIKTNTKPYATCTQCREKLVSAYKTFRFNPENAKKYSEIKDKCCSKCKISQPITSYKTKSDGSLNKACIDCCHKQVECVKIKKSKVLAQ